ncbi:hypothetical protein DFQ28_004952 [Apophysomyces sp. BC1034]|nr:hypothetical protein DFQ29_003850 [Apophysomyces sp. BC1021]KAG0188352.1 hypothetical protein DFQ28_004952 [Apophysomyces sp. BC1034]
MLQTFICAVELNKRAALTVRHLRLCVRDSHYPTVFRPVTNTTVEQHIRAKDSTLADPSIICYILRQCEKLRSLMIYGYHLEPLDLEQLAGFLPDLEEVAFIGSSPSRIPLVSNGAILPRLRSLSLDTTCPISSKFTSTLAKRCQLLQELQVCLESTNPESIFGLCEGKLNLKQLTLTRASHMKDNHVRYLVTSFPNLTKLCLTGVAHITASSISLAVTICPTLCDLEIHAELPSQDAYELATERSNMALCNLPALSLKRLLLKNFAIDDASFEMLVQHCPSLAIIGLSNCPKISDVSIATLCRTSRSLTQFHVINCQFIGRKSIQALSLENTYRTIKNVYVESCGEIKPKDIYDLCCAANPYHLTYVCLVDYEDMVRSTVGGYAIERLDSMERQQQKRVFQVTLDEAAIDALANTDLSADPTFAAYPRDRFLNTQQQVLLAKKLNISFVKLKCLIDTTQPSSLKIRNSDDDDIATCASTTTKRHVNYTADVSAETDQSHQPSVIPMTPKQSPSSYAQPEYTAGKNTTSMVPDFINTSIQEQQDGDTNTDSESSPKEEGHSNISNDYGGWGTTNDLTWMQPSKDVTPWQPDITEKYQEQWKNIAVAAHLANNRSISPSEHNEGWGTATAIVPWEETLGYVSEVLEKQNNTPYFQQDAGVWRELNTNEPAVETQERLTDQQKSAHRFSRPTQTSKDWRGRSDENAVPEYLNYSTKPNSESHSPTGKQYSKPTSTTIPKNKHLKPTDDESSGTETLNGHKHSVFQKSKPCARKTQPRQAIPPERMPGGWGNYTTHLVESNHTVTNDTIKGELVDTKDPNHTENTISLDFMWQYMDTHNQTQSSVPSEGTEYSEDVEEKPESYGLSTDWATMAAMSSLGDTNSQGYQNHTSEDEQEEEDDGDDEEEEEKENRMSKSYTDSDKKDPLVALSTTDLRPSPVSTNDLIPMTPMTPMTPATPTMPMMPMTPMTPMTPESHIPLRDNSLRKVAWKIQVGTPNNDLQPLVLYENYTTRESVREFCDMFNMQKDYETLVLKVEEKYVVHNTKQILKKKSKNKKSKLNI